MKHMHFNYNIPDLETAILHTAHVKKRQNIVNLLCPLLPNVSKSNFTVNYHLSINTWLYTSSLDKPDLSVPLETQHIENKFIIVLSAK